MSPEQAFLAYVSMTLFIWVSTLPLFVTLLIGVAAVATFVTCVVWTSRMAMDEGARRRALDRAWWVGYRVRCWFYYRLRGWK